MSPSESSPIEYPAALAAIGRFIAREQLTDVCVLEFEKGMIVTGSALRARGESSVRHVETHIFSDEELRELLKR